ncbi:MAG: Archaeal ATPase [Syntrophorhabdus sp. PtaU1.Bin058]|nr:MAG: Archaeal ATPase [Syntrophorhabdus sp. PtaU1.Bin058]
MIAMDYLKFFNLTDDPFRLTPDPLYYYPSQEHNEILTSLNYAIEQKEGFSLVVGEPGTGKTTILRILIDNWKDKAEIALIMTPRLSPEEFLQAVLEDINVKLPSVNKNEMIKAFRDILIRHSETGRRIIIIVDEAQNVPDETLEELRLLSNLETEKEKLLQIILMGQSELRKKLQADHLKQLNQRITIKATLKPLTKSETSDYINFRLIKAGRGSVNFDDDAKKAIYSMSKGIPRLINIIASRALMAAFISGNGVIKKNHVQYAIDHLADTTPSRGYLKFAGYGVLGIILIVAIVFGAFKYVNHLRSAVSQANAPRTSAQAIYAGKDQNTGTGSVSRTVQDGQQKILTVSVEIANLRKGPSIETEKIAWANRGSVFRVIDEKKDDIGRRWYKIRNVDGNECWISERVVVIGSITGKR